MVENFSPAGAKLHHGANGLAEQVVAIEVGAAVHKYAIFRIQFPNRIASPVIENEDVSRIVTGMQESHRFLRKMLGFAGILVAGETDPPGRGKQRQQNEDGRVEKQAGPQREGYFTSRAF